MKIISISGTHSVGKSTLLEKVIEEIKVNSGEKKKITCLSETTNNLREIGLVIKEDLSEELQTLILHEDYKRMVYLNEVLRKRGYDVVITDRSLVDTIGYLRYSVEQFGLDPQLYKTALDWVEFYSRVYTDIIYIPIEIPLVHKGTHRSANGKFRNLVDRFLSEFIYEAFPVDDFFPNVPKIHKITGTVEERVEKTLQLIY